jgi:hypothetical protein
MARTVALYMLQRALPSPTQILALAILLQASEKPRHFCGRRAADTGCGRAFAGNSIAPHGRENARLLAAILCSEI